LSGGRVELLLVNHKEGMTFNALIKPSRIKVGEKIIFDGGEISAILSARKEITFSALDINSVYNLGTMPLPPYIKREPEQLDEIYYQTVYAQEKGAIASPTAGLHFTKELIHKIESRGINIAYITLHISYSTFRPVKSQEITAHKMDKEYFKINEDTIRLIERARTGNGRIFAVGTTSCRALETYAGGIGEGYTDLFIYPGYKFRMVDCLVTNFHLPRTSLFMLVCAFAGEGFIKRAYQEAIERKYRFYSYGDAMLIV
jgi:S-adenosylmethionine:tRNA ribosyltransferase-isomerase